MAERLLAKEEVASSTLVFRSSINEARQLAGFSFLGHDRPMDIPELRRMRLSSQKLAAPASGVAETVRWMGALQAQDYQGSFWAVGVRTGQASLSDVERAIARREIVRTWPMRGTLHVISPELVRPVLRLTGPRIKQRAAARHRQLGIDDDVLASARQTLTAEIRRHGPRTRAELYDSMARGGLEPEGQRGIHILSQLSRDLVLCFGPQRAKQPTFVLLDEWLSGVPEVPDTAAAAELARRYFRSHGPATVHDFAWWSSLTLSVARRALDECKHELEAAAFAGREYWFDLGAVTGRTSRWRLLPPFDELVIGYTDRTTVADEEHIAKVVPGSNGMFLATVVDSEGVLRGVWRKQATRRDTGPEVTAFAGALDGDALRAAAAVYTTFISH